MKMQGPGGAPGPLAFYVGFAGTKRGLVHIVHGVH